MAKTRKKRRKLWGAALMAHMKKVGKKKRASKRRMKSNPMRMGRPGRRVRRRRYKRNFFGGVAKAIGLESQVRARHLKRKPGASKRSVAGAVSSFRRKMKKRYVRKRRRAAASAGAITRTARRTLGLTRKRGSTMAKKRRKGRKGSKRSRAAKKAARTRKLNRAKRSAAAKRSYRKRKGGGGRKRRVSRRRSRRVKRVRGTKSLRAARRSIKYARRHGSSRARKYVRKYRMRTNPGGGGGIVKSAINAVKAALPYAAGFYGSRFGTGIVVNQVLARVSASVAGARYARPLGALLTLVGVHYATKKVRALGKHRTGLIVGSAMNVLDQGIKAYGGATVNAYLGTGGMEQDLADYIQTGTGDYIETGMGDYIQTDGMEQDLAADFEQDLGACGDITAPVPTRSMFGPVPRRAMMAPVPEATPEIMESGLHQGIFSGGF